MRSAPRPLDGRTAIVTGASRGIGLAIARRLVDDGARVVITARHADALNEVADAFAPGTVIPVAGKADDPTHRDAVMQVVADSSDGLDILINNAGINPAYGPIVELDEGVLRKIMEVNLLGPLAWVRAAVQREDLHFARRGGSVVNVSSVTGIVPSEGIGAYGISKSGLIHLTRTLAVELGPQVRVNAVAPAVIRTDFAKALYEGREAEVADGYPLRRLGEPTDVAGAVAYLVSPDASWVTGHVLTVDGGLMSAGGTA